MKFFFGINLYLKPCSSIGLKAILRKRSCFYMAACQVPSDVLYGQENDTL